MGRLPEWTLQHLVVILHSGQRIKLFEEDETFVLGRNIVVILLSVKNQTVENYLQIIKIGARRNPFFQVKDQT